MNALNPNRFITVLAGDSRETEKGRIVRVFWRQGQSACKGAYDVLVRGIGADAGVFAELAALRHLLSVKNISGTNRNGENLCLLVSHGAVKKLANMKSQKAELIGFNHFLTTRYAGAEIIVKKDRDWLPEDQDSVPAIEIDLDDMKEPEAMEIPNLGKIVITRHALDKYHEVAGTAGLPQSWRSINRRLRDKLERVGVPAKVALKKQIKHRTESSEIWKNPDNPMHFVFSREASCLVLLTVYETTAWDEQLPRYISAFKPAR
jgi:hypothetical protein